MTKEDLSITYENNIFYCTKNNTKWISVDGEKWYGDEKRIAELEAEVKEWKDKADLWCKTANLKDHNIMINKELEKHNEELIALINAERKRQEQCDDIHLRKIAELEKENAELKKKCYKKAVKDYCELEKENAELKTRVSEQSERISELTQELDDKINRFG